MRHAMLHLILATIPLALWMPDLAKLDQKKAKPPTPITSKLMQIGLAAMIWFAQQAELCDPQDWSPDTTFSQALSWVRSVYRDSRHLPRLAELARFPNGEGLTVPMEALRSYIEYLDQFDSSSRIDGDEDLDQVYVAIKKLWDVQVIWSELYSAHDQHINWLSKRRHLHNLMMLLGERDWAAGRMPCIYPMGTCKRN